MIVISNLAQFFFSLRMIQLLSFLEKMWQFFELFGRFSRFAHFKKWCVIFRGVWNGEEIILLIRLKLLNTNDTAHLTEKGAKARPNRFEFSRQNNWSFLIVFYHISFRKYLFFTDFQNEDFVDFYCLGSCHTLPWKSPKTITTIPIFIRE